MLRFESRVQELIEGAIDIHIHTAPDIFPRIMNDIEIALAAKQAGMRAILLKNHTVITADRAQIARQQTDFPVYGGIALNLTVGGLNVHAVEVALKLGAKEVWLPTMHAAYYVGQKYQIPSLAQEIGDDITGITLLNKDQSLMPELNPIFKKIAEYNIALGTGHISLAEAKAVVPAAARMGVQKIVITHPLSPFLNYSYDDMKEILDNGALFLEFVFNDTTRVVAHPITLEKLANAIQAIGAPHIIMSTDTGQSVNPIPPQAMGIYIQNMLDLGISKEDIRMMVSTNPARMLGI